ncbi:ankyrin repeat domain-containing protein [Wolbachia endosymbiont of Drosophila barbarae]|uniref:ankyrin repeat domain-containing protein n=1 Tax=Wolbachia endosymbiont of Drosophila barbarae TaxID=3377043 RepID=UPI003807BBFF
MFTNRISNNLDQLQFFVEFLNENYETQKHLSLTPLHLAAGNGQLDLVNTLLGASNKKKILLNRKETISSLP